MRLEGYISKKNIRRWLDNYASMVVGDRPYDALPSNSGPKAYDGVSDGRINKIMLDHTLEQLRRDKPRTYACVQARWLLQLRTGEAMRKLGIPQDEYARRCSNAVDFLYLRINGKSDGYRRLAEFILSQ
nr:hypothetical protein [Paenibacillus roseus]